MKPIAVLFIGDLHVGSRQAVCPPELVRGKVQQHLSTAWADLLQRTAQLAKATRLTVALGGDLVEGFHHGNTDDWASDEDEQAQAALELLTPLASRARDLIAVTGTEAHAGKMGSTDRWIYRELGAYILKPGQDVEIAGRYLDWQHHPSGGPGRQPWTVDDGVYRMAKSAHISALWANKEPAALVMRHHVHTMPAAGMFRGTLAAFCGCWQWLTSYAARQGYKSPDIGVWVWWPEQGRLEPWRWPYREKAYKHGTKAQK